MSTVFPGPEGRRLLATLRRLKRKSKKLKRLVLLFLCTGNSCRSQMVEAIVKSNPNRETTAFLAGTQPAQRVHLKTVASLAGVGISGEGGWSSTPMSLERSHLI